MKGIILIFGIAICAIVGCALYFSGYFASEYFEEKTSFGDWGQSITIRYEDGTNESLSLIVNKPLSTVIYNNKAIIGFDYNLNAKVTGTGYTDATVTLNNYVLTVTALGVLGSMPKTMTYSYPLISGSNNVAIDGQYHSIGGVAVFPAKTKLDAAPFSPGPIHITFTPSGTVTFKGNPDGSVQSGSMPSPVKIIVAYSTGGTLSLELSSGIPSYP